MQGLRQQQDLEAIRKGVAQIDAGGRALVQDPRQQFVQELTKMADSPDKVHSPEGDLRPEYDFHKMDGVVRGKYAEAYKEHLRIVRLADDVASAFQAELAVNDALREYLRDHSGVPN